MPNYLDNLTEFNGRAARVIAALATEARIAIDGNGSAKNQIRKINWYNQLLTGANDTSQTEELRLKLLTLVVDDANLNQVPDAAVWNFSLTIGEAPPVTATTWGLISGNINNQTDLIAKFNTYLPLAGGAMTGNITFEDGEGIDVFNEGDTLSIGASAGVVQFGLDSTVRVNIVDVGAWQATPIQPAYGGLGALTLTGQAGKAIVVNGGENGYGFATIPDGSLYVLKAGSTMTGNLLFDASTKIDASSGIPLVLGGTASQVTVNSLLVTANIDAATITGTWGGDVIPFSKGGLNAALSAPGGNRLVGYYNSGSGFVTLSNLSLNNSGVLSLASTLTGVSWGGSTIGVGFGGTGLSSLGSALQYLRVNAGGTALEYATLSGLSNPMTTLGDIIYGAASGTPTRLAGNTSTTRRFLRQTGDGTNSAAPAWDVLSASDIPNIAISQVTNLTSQLSGKLSTTLSNTYMFVGNGAGVAVGVAMSGDATLANTGALTIANSAVTFAKFQNISSGNLLGRYSAGSGAVQEITLGAGLTLSGSGVLSSSGGGGGSPGGATGEVQWNNSGSFDGLSIFTYDGADLNATADNFFFIDATNPTSRAWFFLNNITPGTARRITIQDSNGTMAYLENKLDAFASTTSAELASVISDETGSGALVFATQPTLRTPQIGSGGGNGHYHIHYATSTPSGIASYTTHYTQASTLGWIFGTNAFQSVFSFAGTATRTYTFPDASGNVVLDSATQTLANKTLTSPVINVGSDATGDVYYRDSGGLFTRLGIGTTGQVLTVSAGGIPEWAAGGGGGGGVTTVGTFSASAQANGASISGVTITFGPADASTPGMVSTGTQTWAGAKTLTSALTITPGTNQIVLGTTRTATITAPIPSTSSRTWTMPDVAGYTGNYTFAALEGAQTFSGAKTFSGAITLTRAGSGIDSGAQIVFSGATSNWIMFGATGAGAPTFSGSGRSAGTKLVLFNAIGVSSADYAIGYASTELWIGTATTSTTVGIYAGTTRIARFGGSASTAMTITDGFNVVLGTTTGTQFGTASTQRIGFLGVTPAVAQTGAAQTAGATYGATEQDMLQKAYNALRTFGFLQ